MPEGFKVPEPYNEPVKDYAPYSRERELQKSALADAWNNPREIPMYIGGIEKMTKDLVPVVMPHQHSRVLARRAKSGKSDVKDAIYAALWSKEQIMPDFSFENRVNIVLKAADLLTSDKYRYKMNAATMLGQSMTIYQSEIDAVCEMADFWRYNVKFAEQIYNEQPLSIKGMINSTDHRPLEGFVWALTPFNFTSIGGNLPVAPFIMGNTVVWKPSYQQVDSASVTMEVLKKAGMPDGAINLIYPSGPDASEVILNHPRFAGIHFTGSTEVFTGICETAGRNIKRRVYSDIVPRLVGEVGGKDFILIHESVKEMDNYAEAVATAVIRGSFERQGQKCSAASRIYLPEFLRKPLEEKILGFTSEIKTGSPWDFSNFMCAVIDEAAYDRITGYIERARFSNDAKILYEGGKHSKKEGFFVYPTIIEALDPHYETMEEEFFGPVPTIYYYPREMSWEDVLRIVNETSPYGLTGSVFSSDRLPWIQALDKLRYAAGNIYLNTKPTGAMVGLQPFGGARASGTCDKAGGPGNLRRWIADRTISETTDPPISPWYPHM